MFYFSHFYCFIPYFDANIRLSGPHQNSPLFPIEPKMELLIGVLRFAISEAMTISEISVDDKDKDRDKEKDISHKENTGKERSKSYSDPSTVHNVSGCFSSGMGGGHHSRHAPSVNNSTNSHIVRRSSATNVPPGTRSSLK